MTARLLVAALAVLALGGARIGHAAAGGDDFYANLGYRVDASLRGCWDEAEFRRRIARRAGYDPFRDDAAVSVVVRVTGPASAISGHIQWKNAEGAGMGERRFVARDGNCAKLLAEMDFSVALQIELLRPRASEAPTSVAAAPTSVNNETSEEPAATGAATTSPPPSPPTTEETPPTPPSAEDIPRLERDLRADALATPKEARSDEDSRWMMWVGLGPSLAWGISPSATAAGRLFVGLRHGDLSIELGAEGIYPMRSQSWDGSGFRQVLALGSAGLCGHRGLFSGCLLAKAGGLNAQGLGLDEPKTSTAFIAQAGIRLGATLDLGEMWFLAGHADALALLTPCTVELNDSPVWSMPWLGAFIGIDLGARFW